MNTFTGIVSIIFFGIGFFIGFGPGEIYRLKSVPAVKLSRKNLEQVDNPDDVRLSFIFAKKIETLIEQRKFSEADSLLKQWKPNKWIAPQILKYRGYIALHQEKDLSAVAYWRKLYRQYPETASALSIMGPMAIIKSRLNLPNEQKLLIAGALTLTEEKKYNQALDFLGTTDNDIIAYYRIKIWNKAKQYQEALSYARQFIEKYPESKKYDLVLVNLAYNSARLKKHDKAIHYYHLWLDKFAYSPKKPSIMLSLGDNYVALKKFTEARKWYHKVLESSNQKYIIHAACLSIASTYMWQKNWKHAILWLERALLYQKSAKTSKKLEQCRKRIEK